MKQIFKVEIEIHDDDLALTSWAIKNAIEEICLSTKKNRAKVLVI